MLHFIVSKQERFPPPTGQSVPMRNVQKQAQVSTFHGLAKLLLLVFQSRKKKAFCVSEDSAGVFIFHKVRDATATLFLLRRDTSSPFPPDPLLPSRFLSSSSLFFLPLLSRRITSYVLSSRFPQPPPSSFLLSLPFSLLSVGRLLLCFWCCLCLNLPQCGCLEEVPLL